MISPDRLGAATESQAPLRERDSTTPGQEGHLSLPRDDATIRKGRGKGRNEATLEVTSLQLEPETNAVMLGWQELWKLPGGERGAAACVLACTHNMLACTCVCSWLCMFASCAWGRL